MPPTYITIRPAEKTTIIHPHLSFVQASIYSTYKPPTYLRPYKTATTTTHASPPPLAAIPCLPRDGLGQVTMNSGPCHQVVMVTMTNQVISSPFAATPCHGAGTIQRSNIGRLRRMPSGQRSAAKQADDRNQQEFRSSQPRCSG
jgi:hypothetical protein